MATPNSPLLVFPKAHLSLATLLPYTQGTDGSWSEATAAPFNLGPLSLLGYLDSIILNIEQQNLEAISVDSIYMHRIPAILDANAVVTENYRYQVGASPTSADPGLVIAQCTQYGMCRLQWAYNKVVAHQDLYTLYGLWRRFTPGVQGIGIQKAGFMLEAIDTSYTTVSGVAGTPPFAVTRTP